MTSYPRTIGLTRIIKRDGQPPPPSSIHRLSELRGSFFPETTFRRGEIIMGGKIDIAKGRIEEAAGVLTNNESLQEKGRAEQQVGKVEKVIQEVADTAKDAAAKVVAEGNAAAAKAGK